MSRRATIVLPYGADVWRVANLSEGFIRVAAELASGGFSVELVAPPDSDGAISAPPGVTLTHLAFTDPAILAAPAPGRLSFSLRIGHQLWRHLSAHPPDIVLAPTIGGILQPSLMSRRLGESLGRTSFVIWDEGGTAERLDAGEIEPADPLSIVDEALETVARRFADVLAGPTAVGDEAHFALAFPARPGLTPPAGLRAASEIVFVGPASGRHGAPAFLAAVERLAHAGKLEDRQVTFLGPWREGPFGCGKAMLGRRATNWHFAFTQIDEFRPEAVAHYLRRTGVLAVFAGARPDDDVLITDAADSGVAVAVASHHPLATRLSSLVSVCAADLSDLDKYLIAGQAKEPREVAAADWAGAFEALIAERLERPPDAKAPARSASLCITHRDRPDELALALHSRGSARGPALDAIVVDTGSEASNLERLSALQSSDVRVVEAPPGARQGWARNLAASEASGEILIFLDDDNLFVDDGLSRLISAFDDPKVDLVVSTLSLFDGPSGGLRASADWVFMGQTGWAGLFFNGFGDANFAIRRDRFIEIGGFADSDGAAFDWIFLATAQARGMEIGVLQRPAIGYRRELGSRDRKWRKLDLEGPRRQVLDAYGLAAPLRLILGLTQSLTISIAE